MKFIKSIKNRFAKARALGQSEEALCESIQSYMATKFNRKASDFSVTVKPSIYNQQGKQHKGTAVHIRLNEHCDDHTLVHRMGQEAGRKFTLTNAYSVGVFNAPRPVVQETDITPSVSPETVVEAEAIKPPSPAAR